MTSQASSQNPPTSVNPASTTLSTSQTSSQNPSTSVDSASATLSTSQTPSQSFSTPGTSSLKRSMTVSDELEKKFQETCKKRRRGQHACRSRTPHEDHALSYATRPSRTRSVPNMNEPPPYQRSRPHPQNVNTSRPSNAPSAWGSQRSNERIREMNKRHSNDHEQSTERLREMTTRYSDERSLPSVSDQYSSDHQRPSVSSQYRGEQQRLSTKRHSAGYWDQRPDLVPVRVPSKKGNVLRKKSLRRAEVVSWVGS